MPYNEQQIYDLSIGIANPEKESICDEVYMIHTVRDL